MVVIQIAQIDSPMVLSYVILWIVNICLMGLIIFYIFYKLYIKKEIKTKREAKMYIYNLITWLLFLLFMCLSNICTISFQYLAMDLSFAKIVEQTAVILIYFAIFIKIVYLEYALNKLKYYKGYFFSIISIITIVMFMFIDPATYKEPGNLQIFLLIWVVILYSLLPILYLYLAIKTVGKNRSDALKIFFGVIFLAFGLVAQPLNLGSFAGGGLELIDALIEATYIISPTLLIISTLLIFDSLKEKE